AGEERARQGRRRRGQLRRDANGAGQDARYAGAHPAVDPSERPRGATPRSGKQWRVVSKAPVEQAVVRLSPTLAHATFDVAAVWVIYAGLEQQVADLGQLL